MSEDLIRRSDAIKAIDELPNAYNGWSDTYDKAYIIGTLEEVPSADRPQGEWIFKPLFPNDESEFPMGHLECSVCGSHHRNSTPCNYCDNCGAKMKGADDEL